ncbi:hypothetical protein AVEN_18230-1 [Araneus ventricosus]|uniref:PiggyBac transposable element-derived protein domain-containing protein n=1 Tax=Araneus ventricosus TaxID=182803 RepID=A0A4Y2AIK8_ARAVE|nr:hypothetical protein AVEN_18230-1 [Araneus ventricosus]
MLLVHNDSPDACGRFRNLCAAIRFDDKDTTDTRREIDKLAIVRRFFDSFNENCQYIHLLTNSRSTKNRSLFVICSYTWIPWIYMDSRIHGNWVGISLERAFPTVILTMRLESNAVGVSNTTRT